VLADDGFVLGEIDAEDLAAGDVGLDPLFKPDLDTTRGAGRSLIQYLRLALSEFNRPDSALHAPLALRQFERLFMTTLLLAHRHNYSDLLQGRPAVTAPRDVKRVVDYIHANLDTQITLADLASVSGVPGRTLRQHFSDFKGMAPMAYLRRTRFAEARADLLRRDGRTVTEIARHWGFEHMGRFAAGYRRLFAEPPSATARRDADD
jgi:AraC-like DNA-binding protein